MTDSVGLLPLHYACRNTASLQVVQFLSEQWLEALTKTDVDGSLPLHLACKNKATLDVVGLLVDQWPEAVTIMDSDGRTSLDYTNMAAPANGSDPIPEVVLWLQAMAAGLITDD
jgi:ankyrin repeat protein